MIDEVESRFHVTNPLEITIMKHSTNMFRTDDSLIIWIRHFCRITCLF